MKKKDAGGLPSDINLGFGKPAGPADPTDSFFEGDPTVWLSVDVEVDDPEEAKNKAGKRLGELFAGLNLSSIDDRFGFKVLTRSSWTRQVQKPSSATAVSAPTTSVATSPAC